MSRTRNLTFTNMRILSTAAMTESVLLIYLNLMVTNDVAIYQVYC